jgi:hypothetical protein
VGHGNFWHYLTGEVDGEGRQTSEFVEMGSIFLIVLLITDDA